MPALTVGVVGWLWFLGRISQPQWSARLWVATSSERVLLLRSQVRRFPTGTEPGMPLDMELDVHCGTERYRLFGQTTVAGESDWLLHVPTACPGFAVKLRRVGEPREVLESTFDVREMSPPLSLATSPTRLKLRPSGDELELVLRRGVLAVPFSDELELRWLPPRSDPVVLDVELSGAALADGAQTWRTVAGQVWTIVPTEHVVEMGVRRSDAEGRTSRGFAVLPVKPGAIVAQMNAEGSLEVVAPVPRSDAHVAVSTWRETLAMASVALTARTDVAGRTVFTGHLTLPEAVRRRVASEEVWAVTSSEFDFGSEAQLGIPLTKGRYSGHSTRFGWGGFVDSADEQARLVATERSQWRWRVWLLLVGAWGLELALIAVYTRRALGTPPREALTTGTGLSLTVVYACVTLAFAGLGALFLWW